MSQSTKFSPRASLIALGEYLDSTTKQQLVEQNLTIPQKVLKHSLTDKLKDACLSMLAGAQSLVALNTLARPDTALQRAFGRDACADQLTLSETLNACDVHNVAQMQQATLQIYQQYHKGYAQRPNHADS